jgi:hypothetical protein
MDQNTTPSDIKPNKDGGVGAFVGSLIIIIVIILGGIYVFNSIQEQIGVTKTTESTDTSADETGTKLSEQDDITSLEADLNGSNIDNIDKELESIDIEFENI